MSEETKVTMKIPLFEEGEIEKIDRFTSEIAREINGKVLKEKEMIIAQRLIHNLQARIDKAIENIEHELNGHILLNDEITWNKEFYTNGKLDYRKLLISLLQQTLDILKGSDTNE